MEIAKVKGESASIKAEQDQWVNLTQLESDDVNQNELRPIGIEQTAEWGQWESKCVNQDQ